MEKYYGNYLGLVINNQDPEGRDRVQIYVPGVTNTLYDNWNNDDTNKSIGMDIGSTFTLNEQILKKLKSVLPWAEKATPLIGPGCSVYQQSGGGSSSLPFDGSQSSASTPTSSNFNTSKGDRPPIDGYDTNELTDKTYGVLTELKSQFGNKAIVTSAKRTYDEITGKTYGQDGKEVNSTKNSAHNSGNAFDISIKGLSEKDKEEISRFVVERGFNEILEHGEGDNRHLHFGNDLNQTGIAFSNQSYMKEIEKDVKNGVISTGNAVPAPIIRATPPVAAHLKSPEETKDQNSVTIIPAEGKPTDYETPKSIVGPGTPEGNRSTTRPLCRVWLFFYGGDVQKPVFFAYSLPPNETYAHNSVSAPNQTDSESDIIDQIPIDLVSPINEITSDGSESNDKIVEPPLPLQNSSSSSNASPVKFEIVIPDPQYTRGKKL